FLDALVAGHGNIGARLRQGDRHRAVLGRAVADNEGDFARQTRHQSSILTSPVRPSTVIRSPSLIIAVAPGQPTTAGSPYSRAAIAACERRPPESVTRAPAIENSGVQLGVVVTQTRTSPAPNLAASETSARMRARAVTRP